MNVYLIRKYAALIMGGLIPVMGYVLGLQTSHNFLMSVAISLACVLISVLLGMVLLYNPFTAILEGKGILCFDLTSTGVMRPFILKILPPYVAGKAGNDKIIDVFDRDAVFNMATPIKTGTATQKIDGGLHIDLDEKQYNSGRFALFHYPTFIYNSQVKSIITKEFISESEKHTFAEHGILFLNRKMEELTGITRDFARYVVEMTKPKSEWYKSGWVWVIVVVLVIILIAIFLPSIIGTITKSAGSLAGTATGGIISPK